MPISFSDPVYGVSTIPDSLRRVLESPPLARLRNIRQLGFTNAKYCGAVHTRFEHSVGTTEAMRRLLDQFGVEDADERERYFLAALVSEIGMYPLSYSSRPLFSEFGNDKRTYARLLAQQFLKHELGLRTDEFEFILDASQRSPSWFEDVRQFEPYSYMDPVKLASTIDYVLRDSYYTGRFVGGFDYRFFVSLRPGAGSEQRSALLQGLQALHRAVFHLGATYGDPTRRLLSCLLVTFVKRVLEDFPSGQLRDPEFFLELDDDALLAELGRCASLALRRGDVTSAAMYAALVGERPHRLVPLPDLDGAAAATNESSIARLSHNLGTPAERIVTEQMLSSELGFRMFGTEYRTLAAALEAPEVEKRTGLSSTGLLPTENLRYALVF